MIFLFSLILLLPGTLIGYISYDTASTKVESDLTREAKDNVTLLNQYIDNYFDGKIRGMDYLSSSFNGDFSDTEKVRAILATYNKSNSDVINSYVATPDKRMILAPDTGLPEGYDPTERSWYTEQMVSDKAIITEPYVDIATNQMVITITVTLPDGKGVLGIDLDINALNDITKSAVIGDEGYVFVAYKGSLSQAFKTDEERLVYVTHRYEDSGKIEYSDSYNTLFKQDTGELKYIYNSDKDREIEEQAYNADIESAKKSDNAEMVSDLEKQKKLLDEKSRPENNEREMYFETNKLTGWKIAGTISVDEIKEHSQPILTKTITIIILSIVIGAVIAYLILSPIFKSLNHLVNASKEISNGNLTNEIKVERNDEIGQLTTSFNKMTESLRTILNEVTHTVEEVSKSSEILSINATSTKDKTEHIVSSVYEMSKGANKQLESNTTNSLTLNQMVEDIHKIAEASAVVSHTSSNATTEAINGNNIIQEVVTQMNTINTSVEESSEVVTMLGEKSDEIGKILDVITGISEQTNLLALNAAIEAARAGEHGRGFAIVADEVRKLAEQSKNAAVQIAQLIQEIQSETNKAVLYMDKGKNEMNSGIQVVHDAGETFRRILNSVQDVANRIEEISNASQQMFENSKEVTESVKETNEISKESSENATTIYTTSKEQLASVEEISNSAISLTKLAVDLKNKVSKFKTK